MERIHRRYLISVSEENYFALKDLGKTGDSFNRVVTRLLKKEKPLQTESGVGMAQ
jgi:hypothetical protein